MSEAKTNEVQNQGAGKPAPKKNTSIMLGAALLSLQKEGEP